MTKEQEILNLVKEVNPENPIEYVCSIVRPMARQKMDCLMSKCQDCPACKNHPVRSVSYGDDRASVLIINEGIYESQLEDGKDTVYPLQGTPEMELIDTLIDACHINRKQLFWMNAVNCFTCTHVNGKNIERAPNGHEAEYCRGYIEDAIQIIHPVLIILLGNIPLNLFHRGKSIKEMHGKFINIDGVQAMPLYSPHSLVAMQNSDTLEDLIAEYETEFCEDFRKAFKYVQDNFEGNVVLEPLD